MKVNFTKKEYRVLVEMLLDRYIGMELGDAFEDTGGVVAIHRVEITARTIKPIRIACLRGADERIVAHLVRPVGDQHRRNRADQYLHVVTAVAGEKARIAREAQAF